MNCNTSKSNNNFIKEVINGHLSDILLLTTRENLDVSYQVEAIRLLLENFN